MGLSLENVSSGAPTLYVYKDYETGEKKVSNRPLNADGTPYTEPTDNIQAEQATENAPLGA